jgi:hypothetical protein
MISRFGCSLSSGIGMVVVVGCGLVVVGEGFVVEVDDDDDDVVEDDDVSVGVSEAWAPAPTVVVVSSDAAADSTVCGAVDVVVSLAPDVQAATTSANASIPKRIRREAISGTRFERTCP